MIEQLIDYLVNLPTPASSPIAVALNVSGVLTELGPPSPAAVNLIDNRDTVLNPPYVRFYDSGEVEIVRTFIGGPNRLWMEALYMNIECAAYGPTASLAGARADYLRLAVEGKLQSLISTIINVGITPRADLAGSNSTDAIKLIRNVGAKSGPQPQGPGEDVDNPQWTATRITRVLVWVYRSRMA